MRIPRLVLLFSLVLASGGLSGCATSPRRAGDNALDIRSEWKPLLVTAQHLQGGEGGIGVAIGDFFDLFVGPYTFEDLAVTFRHLD